MSQHPYPQAQLYVGLGIADFFWVFLADLCAILCVKKLELSRNRLFRIFLGVTFLRLVYFIQYLFTFVEICCFRFLIYFQCFLATFSLLVFQIPI